MKEKLQKLYKEFDNLVEQQKALASKDSMTEDDIKEFDALQEKIDTNGNEVKRLETLIDNEEKASRQVTKSLPLPASHNKQHEKLDDGGFKSLGEFVKCAVFGDKQGRLEKAMFGTDDHGNNATGFLIPPQYAKQILQIPKEIPFVRNLATVIPGDASTPDASITFPVLDYGTNPYGGVTVDWVEDEGGAKPETEMKMGSIEYVPHEIAGWIPVSDKLLRNSAAAETLVKTALTDALLMAEQDAFLTGNGTKKPIGVFDVKNTALIKITAATPGTVAFADLVKMRARMNTASYSKAVWVIDQTYMPDIIGMTDGNGRLIYLQGNINSAAPDMLLGRPVMWTNSVVGVSLVDFSQYIIKDGAGLYIAASEHVRFTSNQTVIKIFEYTDGAPWVKAPYKYKNNLTLSPYIQLTIGAGGGE